MDVGICGHSEKDSIFTEDKIRKIDKNDKE